MHFKTLVTKEIDVSFFFLVKKMWFHNHPLHKLLMAAMFPHTHFISFFSLFNKHPNYQTHTPQVIAPPLIFPFFVFLSKHLKKHGFVIIHYTNSSWLPCFHTLISFHFFSLFNKHPNFQTHTPQSTAPPLIFCFSIQTHRH